MIKKSKFMLLVILILNIISYKSFSQEKFRPQIHFTPNLNWMNDPNGMFFYKGIYHLYYQHFPEKPVWGPMHWGHATSKDLINWEHHPIALKPDSLGTIFSGSIVLDKNNTSGFGVNGKVPMVAIFTQFNPKIQQNGRIDYQNQSIAYSLDNGYTWVKYASNPVLKNPGIADFRDPKVIWHDLSKKWIMVLATQDKISFYGSKNLKEWEKLSDFGQSIGAHGGVWECPDLFPLTVKGKTKWILLSSINPGAYNGGSGTQYFIGDFDGKKFESQDMTTRWLDYGKDNYAGVTFSGLQNSRIFMGWMSNWQYADKVPTESWRGATTIPRKLKLIELDNKFFLLSFPVSQLDKYSKKRQKIQFNRTIKLDNPVFRLNGSLKALNDFELIVKNSKDENIKFGFEASSNRFYIDRTTSGNVSFNDNFKGRHYAPRLSKKSLIDFQVIVDVASIEVFVDGGLTTMTEIFFPSSAFDSFQFNSKQNGELIFEEISSVETI